MESPSARPALARLVRLWWIASGGVGVGMAARDVVDVGNEEVFVVVDTSTGVTCIKLPPKGESEDKDKFAGKVNLEAEDKDGAEEDGAFKVDDKVGVRAGLNPPFQIHPSSEPPPK